MGFHPLDYGFGSLWAGSNAAFEIEPDPSVQQMPRPTSDWVDPSGADGVTVRTTSSRVIITKTRSASRASDGWRLTSVGDVQPMNEYGTSPKQSDARSGPG